jgi:FlaA1/EpsC-like NDP-sugar epimerase
MAQFHPKNILFFGATGTIGRYILDAVLSARDEFDRIVIFTAPYAEGKDSEKARYLKQIQEVKRVEIVMGDITEEKAVLEAYKGNHQLLFIF